MKHTVNRYFKLWLAFFRNTLSRDMEFKMNFIFEIFIDIIYYGSLFFFFKVIFQFVDALGDFIILTVDCVDGVCGAIFGDLVETNVVLTN